MNANTVIVYASKHHGNTKKLLEALAEQEDVELLDIAENEQYDLSGYSRIGIASGIAYGKYYPQMLKFLENNLPCDDGSSSGLEHSPSPAQYRFVKHPFVPP